MAVWVVASHPLRRVVACARLWLLPFLAAARRALAHHIIARRAALIGGDFIALLLVGVVRATPPFIRLDADAHVIRLDAVHLCAHSQAAIAGTLCGPALSFQHLDAAGIDLA